VLYIHFVFYVFFFQAEDGIRDFHVTGVQTCALPISRLDQMTVGILRDELGLHAPVTSARSADLALFGLWCIPSILTWLPLPLVRSEERRVGKECRWRWSAYNGKKRGWGQNVLMTYVG